MWRLILNPLRRWLEDRSDRDGRYLQQMRNVRVVSIEQERVSRLKQRFARISGEPRRVREVVR